MQKKIVGMLTLTALASAAYAAPMKTSAVDKKYLMDNAQGSVYDFSTAELATQRGSAKVRDYGVMLMDDHARLNKKMLLLANERNLMLPITLQSKDKSSLMRMMKLNGASFDRAIAKEFIKINAEDVKSARKELSVTKDLQVKAIVGDFLKTEQKHLAGAQKLSAGMKMKM